MGRVKELYNDALDALSRQPAIGIGLSGGGCGHYYFDTDDLISALSGNEFESLDIRISIDDNERELTALQKLELMEWFRDKFKDAIPVPD